MPPDEWITCTNWITLPIMVLMKWNLVGLMVEMVANTVGVGLVEIPQISEMQDNVFEVAALSKRVSFSQCLSLLFTHILWLWVVYCIM